MFTLLFLLCHSTLFADGQCTVSNCKHEATESNKKLEEYDEKLQLMIQSMSNRIIGEVEKLFANGFQQMNSVTLSRESQEEQYRKLQRTHQNLTKEIDRIVAEQLAQKDNQTEDHGVQLKLMCQNLSSETEEFQQNIFHIASPSGQSLEELDRKLQNLTKRMDQSVSRILDQISSEIEKLQQNVLQTVSSLGQSLEEQDQRLQNLTKQVEQTNSRTQEQMSSESEKLKENVLHAVSSLGQSLEKQDRKLQNLTKRMEQSDSRILEQISSEVEKLQQNVLEEQDQKLQNLTKQVEQTISRTQEQIQVLYQNLSSQTQKLQHNVLQVASGINQSLEDQEQKLRRLYQNITERRKMIDDRFQSGIQQANYKLQEHDSNLMLFYQNLSTELVKVQKSLIQIRGENQLKEHDRKVEIMHQNLSSENEKIQQLLLQTTSRLNQTLGKHDQTLQRVNEGLYREIQAVNVKLDSCSSSKSVGVYDCSDVKANGFLRSRTYGICVDHQQKRYRFDAYCDMNTANGNWLVFQRRKDGSQNFTRGWTDYANGFGDLNGEFWLGNEFLYLLTSKRRYKLRIDLENWTGEKRYAEYSSFSVSSSADKYRLVAGGYSGTAGDSLNHHSGAQFSTYDNDSTINSINIDNPDWKNCAAQYRGGWWYKSCHYANLNGLYYIGGNYSSPLGNGINWYYWYSNSWRYSFKTTEMKISPIA